METNSQNRFHDPNTSKQTEDVIAAIMVPFPEQSHLNQLLHLSCLVSSYNINVHYACSPTHIQQAKLRFNDKDKLESSKIYFHELPIPPFLSLPPDPNSETKFPSHLEHVFDASLKLRHPMAELIEAVSASSRRVVVIHDFCMSYTVQDATNVPNTELYAFNPISAFSNVFNGVYIRDVPSPINELEGLPSNDGGELPVGIRNFVSLQIEFLKSSMGTIFNSCRPMEGTYLDLLEKEEISKMKKLWAVGPLNLGTNVSKSSLTSKHKCIEWLDKQAPNSVLYVSFGTTTSMKEEEIKELAMGLEQSRQKFIWVLRDADRSNIFEGDDTKLELPKGFEERMKGVGIVVRDWAPQPEILEHSSTGGFMSHCGWNSCLESMTMGVPVAACPILGDQPMNAYLLTEILKVGVSVRTWEQKDEIVKSSVIAKAVETLMVTNEGTEMRERAQKLSFLTQEAVKEGGVSRVELDSLIAHMTR